MEHEPLMIKVRLYEEIGNPATRLQAVVCSVVAAMKSSVNNTISAGEAIVALRNLADAYEIEGITKEGNK